MKSLTSTALLVLLSTSSLAQEKAAAGEGKWTAMALKGQEIFATFETSMGSMTVRLFSKDAPKTVANFVGLAAGERAWGPQGTKKPLYDGTIFHRIIPNFMIQGGDPLGNGTGGPGYRFEDEFQSGRTFDKVGILAMANAGPNTNGSQFFITTSTPHHLDNHHTIFGEIVAGMDVLQAIGNVPRGPMDRPVTDVVLKTVKLSATAPAAAKPAAPAAPAKAAPKAK